MFHRPKKNKCYTEKKNRLGGITRVWNCSGCPDVGICVKRTHQ